MEWLKRDGVSIAFVDAGKGAPPILLIHDLGYDHTSWQAQFEHFRHRHRVVAIDLPGHGQSNRLPQAHTIPRFADYLAWLCYELGLYRPVAVGLGFGGKIAAYVDGTNPELLAAVVALDARVLESATQVTGKIEAVIRRTEEGVKRP